MTSFWTSPKFCRDHSTMMKCKICRPTSISSCECEPAIFMGCRRLSLQPTTQLPPASRWCLRDNSVHLEGSRHACIGDSGSKGRGYHRPETCRNQNSFQWEGHSTLFGDIVGDFEFQDSNWSMFSIWNLLSCHILSYSMNIGSWDPLVSFSKGQVFETCEFSKYRSTWWTSRWCGIFGILQIGIRWGVDVEMDIWRCPFLNMIGFHSATCRKNQWFSLDLSVLPNRNLNRTHEYGGCPTMAVWVVSN